MLNQLVSRGGVRAVVMVHESLDTLKHYAKLTTVDLKKTHRKCHTEYRQEQNAV